MIESGSHRKTGRTAVRPVVPQTKENAMKVKLNQYCFLKGAEGIPGQVVSCSKEIGERLAAQGCEVVEDATEEKAEAVPERPRRGRPPKVKDKQE